MFRSMKGLIAFDLDCDRFFVWIFSAKMILAEHSEAFTRSTEQKKVIQWQPFQNFIETIIVEH